jgi:hypothetical protein
MADDSIASDPPQEGTAARTAPLPGDKASLVLDLKDEAGMTASWETLVDIYGWDPVLELFKVGISNNPGHVNGDFAEEMVDLFSAIADAESKTAEAEAAEAYLGTALSKLRAAGQRWFGPAWFEENEIPEGVIKALLARGELVKHPTIKANIGLPESAS